MRAALLALSLLNVGAATAAEGPVAALNALARLEAVQVTENLSYADGPRHRLDVYAPSGQGQGRPVVVFFYGGGWEAGERAMYRFVGAALASRGFVTIIPDYRLYPEVRFPAFVEDGARAVRWARDHAAEFGGDPSRLVLIGHSAGAQIATLLAFDDQWLATVKMVPRRDLAGVVGLAGPYDFLPLGSAKLKKIFPEPGRGSSQPINVVTGEEPPAFLATGANDTTVDPANSARLAARIRQKGGEATLIVYKKADHRLILGAFSRPLRLVAPVLDDVSGFLDRVTMHGAPPPGNAR
ncbi:alpha/beta hydrolase [Ancylobacter sp.]|uniref:alpha/beta hydrolase n=1 Tax=Ancylobacter sp. TaxID=1872567 RepID=UPI003D115FBF